MTNDPNKDAHSLGIALRLAQAQNRDLRKANEVMREALVDIADEWPHHADSPENIRNSAKRALEQTDRAT